jgi:hypothetical protein
MSRPIHPVDWPEAPAFRLGSIEQMKLDHYPDARQLNGTRRGGRFDPHAEFQRSNVERRTIQYHKD